jgi:polyisoprenoid-binding protein YceI
MLRKWTIDPKHSSISFGVRHMLVSRVRGSFTRFAGALEFAEAVPPASSVVVAIDAGSIDTNVPERDAHLISSDFLASERHPFIWFRSTRVEASGPARLRVHGDLTIRGVTREVALDVEYGGRVRDPDGKERVGFAARAGFSRKAFGITFNRVIDAGGLALGDTIEVLIDVSAVADAGSRVGWQPDREGGGLVVGFEADGATMRLHDGLHDRQPEAEAA